MYEECFGIVEKESWSYEVYFIIFRYFFIFPWVFIWNYSVVTKEKSKLNALMFTDFVLQIPNIVIQPTIEELQSHFGQVITNLIETHKGIIMWGQRYIPNNERRTTLGEEIIGNTVIKTLSLIFFLFIMKNFLY